MERCESLEEKRKLVERDEMREWKTRHSRNQLEKKKKEGPVGPEKEEEEDKMESFFYHVYEFHNPVPNAPAFVPAEVPPRYAIDFVPAVSAVTPMPVVVPAVSNVPSVVSAVTTFVPAEFPARYAIKFVPAIVPDVPPVSPVIVSSSSSSYSVVSSANFVIPSSPTYCMPTN